MPKGREGLPEMKDGGDGSVKKFTATVESKLANRQKQREPILRKINNLRSEIAKHKLSIADIQSKIEDKKSKISTLCSQTNALTYEIYELEFQLSQPQKYRSGLAHLITRLRAGDAGGYGNVSQRLFHPDEFGQGTPITTTAKESSLTLEMKREIIASVLAETGLTEEEANRLLKTQANKIFV